MVSKHFFLRLKHTVQLFFNEINFCIHLTRVVLCKLNTNLILITYALEKTSVVYLVEH